VGLAQRLSASSEGMSATAATHPGIRFTTVQGLLQITNRAGKFKTDLSKEQINFYPLYHPARQISQEKNFVKFFQRLLTKRRRPCTAHSP
jgi:uracil-DNA glycosylase